MVGGRLGTGPGGGVCPPTSGSSGHPDSLTLPLTACLGDTAGVSED